MRTGVAAVLVLVMAAAAAQSDFAAPPVGGDGGPVPAPSCPAGAEPGKMTFAGTGAVYGVPDQATVSLLVSADADTAREARELAAVASSRIYTTLEESDAVEPEDISTSGLSVTPKTEYNSTSGVSVQVGWTYQNTLSITLRNITGDALADVLDSVVEAGGNVTSISSVSLALSTDATTLLTNDARKLAVANAKATAALYAQELGVSLGPLLEFKETSAVSVSTPSSNNRDAAAAPAAAAATPTPVSLGQEMVGASIQVTYGFCSET